MCIKEPAAALRVVGSAQRWAREHSTALLLSVSLVVGAALVVWGR